MLSIGLSLNDIPLVTIDGEPTSFAAYADNVKLIVNVASRCGLTPQYKKLEELHKTYGGRGFTVLGFPSNQFICPQPATRPFDSPSGNRGGRRCQRRPQELLSAGVDFSVLTVAVFIVISLIGARVWRYPRSPARVRQSPWPRST